MAVKDPEGVVFEYPVEDQEAAGISTIIDRTSALGTFETCRLHRAMSAFANRRIAASDQLNPPPKADIEPGMDR